MDWKAWLKAAGIRATKTFAQAVLALIALNDPVLGVVDVDWVGIASVAALAAVVSLLTSVVGLPEVPKTDPNQPTVRGRV